MLQDAVMMRLMEAKEKFNVYVYKSVADRFVQLTETRVRGEKGTLTSAALLAFLLLPAEEQQQFIDMIKLAEGRGGHGTIIDAAIAVMGSPPNLAARHGTLNPLVEPTATPGASDDARVAAKVAVQAAEAAARREQQRRPGQPADHPAASPEAPKGSRGGHQTRKG